MRFSSEIFFTCQNDDDMIGEKECSISINKKNGDIQNYAIYLANERISHEMNV